MYTSEIYNFIEMPRELRSYSSLAFAGKSGAFMA